MMIIGLTGSLASGKTTASKIIANKRGPLFSADKIVKKLYNQKKFKRTLAKKLNFRFDKDFKKNLKNKIIKRKEILRKLEKIIHPLVRKKMQFFTIKHKNKKLLFYEIPLLIESKLMKFFHVIIFVKANKSTRYKRFKSKKGDKKLFHLLNNRQLEDSEKINYSDHIVVNESNLNILKKNLLAIIRKYE